MRPKPHGLAWELPFSLAERSFQTCGLRYECPVGRGGFDYEKQIAKDLRSVDFGAGGRILDWRHGADHGRRSGSVGTAECSHGNGARASRAAGAPERW